MSDKEAGSVSNGRGRRLFVGLFVLLVGLVVLISVYLWSERRVLMSSQVAHFLTTSGVQTFDFDLASVGFSGAHFRSVRIGEADHAALLVENLRLKFSLAGLLGSRIDAIDVGSLRLRAALGADGLGLGQLAPLLLGGTTGLSGGTTGEAGAFSVGEISVDDLQVAVALPQGMVELGGGVRLSLNDGDVRIQPTDGCLRYALNSVQIDVGTFDDVSGVICLADPDTGVSWPFDAALDLMVSDSPVVLRGDDGGVLLEADLTGLGVRVGGTPLRPLSARVRGSRLVLPGFDLALSEFSLEVGFSAAADGGLLGLWKLDRARLADLSPEGRFAPVRLAGDGQITAEQVTFDIIVSEPQSLTPLLSVVGGHETESGSGSAVVGLGPLRFSPEGLQPQNIVPALKGQMTNVAGGASGEGRFRWTPGRLTSNGTLNLDDIALSTETARIEGVGGVLSFENLLPLVTAPEQFLSVGLVDAGFRLSRGTVTFAVKESGEVQIEQALWPFAGGSISLSSGLIKPGALEQQLVLAVDNVDLAALIELLNLDGLSGTGRVTGRVPIVIRDGDPLVIDAQLVAIEDGQLSYQGAGTGALEGGQSALLFQALEDFRYTSLTLSLDGNAQGRLTLKLSLEGANPELFSGYPFAININTEASFAELLRSATLSAKALDLIRESDAERQVDEMERPGDGEAER